MEDLALVARYLGGRKAVGAPRTELDLIARIRSGLPYSVVTALRDHTALSEAAIWESLRIPARTAARRKKTNATLKPAESELLVRLARVLVAAHDVFGNKETARAWLTSPNRALGGAIPLRLLDTGIGFTEVMDVLGRIEHGVHS